VLTWVLGSLLFGVMMDGMKMRKYRDSGYGNKE
jgi:hypothetical protein